MKRHTLMPDWLMARRELAGSVGFVPTMGALHAGHASLIERSVAECDVTVLSIYVNPTQFNNPDDLARYPDTMDADLKLAETLGVNHVILPGYQEIYADDYRYKVSESQLSNDLCGAHRPGHFDGVLTVVMKLLNLVQADRAYFGEKDYQQFQLIRDMAQAFFMPTEIVPCTTVREEDGLALSSRNLNLDPCSRRIAPVLNRLLRSGLSDQAVACELARAGFDVDYIETRNGRRFGAAALTCQGVPVRLIDNVMVENQL